MLTRRTVSGDWLCEIVSLPFSLSLVFSFYFILWKRVQTYTSNQKVHRRENSLENNNKKNDFLGSLQSSAIIFSVRDSFIFPFSKTSTVALSTMIVWLVGSRGTPNPVYNFFLDATKIWVERERDLLLVYFCCCCRKDLNSFIIACRNVQVYIPLSIFLILFVFF